MKILAPVNSVEEAEVLIAEGAQELYCGLHPSVWGHGDGIWMNRRGPGSANISNLAELAKLVELAHQAGVQVFLTLNQSFYAERIVSDVLSLVMEVAAFGMDAYIVGDPGLMIAIKEVRPDAVIHVSSLAGVLSSGSASFFRDLGASRIIFPRYLDLPLMQTIMDRVGRDLEYEVFILNDGCVFEEGYCNVSHAFGGAFCHVPRWSYDLVEVKSYGLQDERASVRKDNEDFARHVQDYREWLWLGIQDLGEHLSPMGRPLGMCGLCALPQLKELGVTSLKIVGREAPSAKKRASVALIRTVLEYIQAGAEADVVSKVARRLREEIKPLCDTGYMCYNR